MKISKKAQCFFIVLALILALIPIQALADEDDDTYDVVGWYDESGLDAVNSVKVNGVKLSEFEPSMYVAELDANTAEAQPSDTISVEISLKSGYKLSSSGGYVLYLSGVQSEVDHVARSKSKTSIQLPSADWYSNDQEFYLAFKTERAPKSGSSITTIDSIVLDVDRSVNCGTTVKVADKPVPGVSVPSGNGYSIVPGSPCWVKKDGDFYDENVSSFYAKGRESVVFKVDITDEGPYVFSDDLKKKNITINNGTLLDYEVFTYGGSSAASKYHEICLTVGVKINHVWDKGKVTKRATMSSEGVRTYKCKRCGEIKTEAIPKKETKPLMAKMRSKGKTSLVLSWSKVKGAEGYDIFFARCNTSEKKTKAKLVKTIKGNKKTSWTKTGLKKNTAYKSYVKAWKMVKGKKKYLKKSPTVHAYTSGGSKTGTNVKSLSVRKTKVSLKVGSSYKIKATIKKLGKGKTVMAKSHGPKLRYRSTNKNIATVTKSGRIKGRSKGTCHIYVYAINGVSKKIKVTVK